MKKKILYTLFIFLFSILCTNYNAKAQIGKVIEKDFILNELIINNQNFRKALLKNVFNVDQIRKLDKNYYYILSIQRDTIYDNIFLMSIDLLPPIIAEKPNNLGCIYLDNTPIIVRGCNPNNLFLETNKERKFHYKYYDLPRTEEFLSWYFLYINKEMLYLDLPEYLISRLGFVLCE